MAITETPKPKASETTREYIVLMQVALGDPAEAPAVSWTIVGTPTAANDAQARKIVGQSLPEDERDAPLVAVPVRYWQPKQRKVKVTTSETWD